GRARTGTIADLVAHDEVADLDARLQRSRRARPDDPLHAELLHRPQVGAVVDRVRWELVLDAVPRDERDPIGADRPDDRRRRGPSVGGFDLDGLGIVEERVEARAAEHSDLRFGGRSGHDDEFSFLLPVVDALPFEPFEDEPPSAFLEVEPPSESEDVPPDDAPPSESFVDAAPDDAFARLSVAHNPEPLNTTPAGRAHF